MTSKGNHRRPPAAVPCAVDEIAKGSEAKWIDKSVKVIGRLIQHVAENSRALLEDPRSKVVLPVCTCLIEPVEALSGALLQLTGDMVRDSSGYLTLLARSQRVVDGLDLTMYFMALHQQCSYLTKQQETDD